MIKVIVEKNKIEMSGHAMYDDYGRDIVCSAASSILTTTVNACLTLKENSIKYMVSEKGVTINNTSCDDITNKLLTNMIKLLKELQEEYPENIEVKER